MKRKSRSIIAYDMKRKKTILDRFNSADRKIDHNDITKITSYRFNSAEEKVDRETSNMNSEY